MTSQARRPRHGRRLNSRVAGGKDPEYDVFLSYNRKDISQVKRVARRLMVRRGLVPWLDMWELRPGLPWRVLLAEALARARSAAVFFGKSGIGPWQSQELDVLHHRFVEGACPVIPVILPNVVGSPNLPPFLEGKTWVDFRQTDPDPIEHLVWGITGMKGPSAVRRGGGSKRD